MNKVLRGDPVDPPLLFEQFAILIRVGRVYGGIYTRFHVLVIFVIILICYLGCQFS